jgi:2-methylisocitrate lyase-like PEP mutase family enzyme
MVQGGVSPHVTVSEAKTLGFRVVIYPAISTRAAYLAMKEALQHLTDTGDFPEKSGQIPPAEVYRVCGLNAAVDFDLAAGGNMYRGGV